MALKKPPLVIPSYPVAKERIAMEWKGKDGNHYILTRDGFGFCNGQCTSTPWFDQLLDYRAEHGFNNIIIITGQAGISKSCMGLALCERHDPTFNVYRVRFSSKGILSLIHEIEDSGVTNVYMQPDEVGWALGSRDWWREISNTLTKVMESFRFLQIHTVLPCIDPSLVDIRVRESLAHFMIWVTSRGFAKVYKYYKSPFTGKLITIGLGEIMQFYPSLELWKAYEVKRRRFEGEEIAKATKEAEAKEVSAGGYTYAFDKIMENPNLYMDENGHILVGKMMRLLGVSYKNAYVMKADLEHELRKALPQDSS